jgi:1-acyl-sn-glycerol-3-phosphate acyltransferase
MSTLRKYYRWFFLGLLIIIGIPITVIFLRGTIPTRGLTSRIITGWLSIVTRLFGIRIKTYGTALSEKTLFVANHITWLDIFVIGGLIPLHFLSKHEVKTMPVLGWLATRAGTLYINRGYKASASDASSEITSALNQQHNSLIFAEGTTTDGNIKKFHSRMMQSAIDAHAMVQPIAIFYPVKNPKTKEIESNPVALFIGKTTLGESANLIFRSASIDVEIHYLEPIDSTGKTRDEISQHAYEEVLDAIEKIKKQTE